MSVLISIVIPTYNRSKDLKRALNSVMGQTYSNWEAIVVDNHSDDDTEKVIKSFGSKKIKMIKIHNNGVIAASRNMGIQVSKGEYIAFLDSDDWWMANKLEESVKKINQGADFVFHPLYLVTNENPFFFSKVTKTRHLEEDVFSDLLKFGNCICNSSVVVNKKILDLLGGICISPELIAIEDYDTWLRIAQKSNNFIQIMKPLGYYWIGGGNMTNPQRTLDTIQAIENKYSKEIEKISENGYMWFNYAKAKAYMKLGKYPQGLNYLKSLNLKNAPLDVIFKHITLKIYLNWKRVYYN